MPYNPEEDDKKAYESTMEKNEDIEAWNKEVKRRREAAEEEAEQSRRDERRRDSGREKERLAAALDPNRKDNEGNNMTGEAPNSGMKPSNEDKSAVSSSSDQFASTNQTPEEYMHSVNSSHLKDLETQQQNRYSEFENSVNSLIQNASGKTDELLNSSRSHFISNPVLETETGKDALNSDHTVKQEGTDLSAKGKNPTEQLAGASVPPASKDEKSSEMGKANGNTEQKPNESLGGVAPQKPNPVLGKGPSQQTAPEQAKPVVPQIPQQAQSNVPEFLANQKMFEDQFVPKKFQIWDSFKPALDAWTQGDIGDAIFNSFFALLAAPADMLNRYMDHLKEEGIRRDKEIEANKLQYIDRQLMKKGITREQALAQLAVQMRSGLEQDNPKLLKSLPQDKDGTLRYDQFSKREMKKFSNAVQDYARNHPEFGQKLRTTFGIDFTQKEVEKWAQKTAFHVTVKGSLKDPQAFDGQGKELKTDPKEIAQKAQSRNLDYKNFQNSMQDNQSTRAALNRARQNAPYTPQRPPLVRTGSKEMAS